MKNQEENIDKLFKAKLSNRSLEIPEAFIADLESKLPAQKKKKVWIWWMSSFVLTTLFLSLLYFEFTSSSNTSSLSNNSSIPSTQEHDNYEESKLSSSHQQKNDTIDSKSSNENFKKDKDVDIKIVTKNESTNDLNTNSVLDTLNFESINIKTTSQNTEKEKNSTIHTSQNKSSLTAGATLDSDQNTAIFTESDSLIDKKRTQDQLFTTNFYSDSVKIKDSLVIRDSIVIRDSVVIRDSIIIRDSIVIKDSVRFQNTKNKNFELRMFGGASNITSLTNSSNTTFNEMIQESTESIFSSEFGLSMRYNINKLNLGLGISQYNYGERLDYQISSSIAEDSIFISFYDVNVVFDSIMGTFDTIYTPVFDTTQVSSNITEQNTYTNNYAKLAIPISLGYRFDYKKWSFVPQFDIVLEIELKKGTRNYPNLLFDQTIPVLPNTISFSYMAQMEIRRNFSNWYLYASPFYRNNFTHIVSQDDFSQKYRSFGCLLGTGIKL